MNNFLPFETVKGITVLAFMASILITLGKFLTREDNEERSMQKIIGGLSVFVVAIISQNAWVFSLSLFIGGLIIASEKFMRYLVAILKSTSGDIPEVLTGLGKLEITQASPSEIKETQKEEVKHTLKPNIKDTAVIKRVMSAEKLVADYYQLHFGAQFQPQAKLENEYGSLIVDGVINNKEGGGVASLLEIKYLTRTDEEFVDLAVRKSLEKVRYLLLNVPLTIAFVRENLKKEQAEDIEKKIQVKGYKGIEFSFFTIDKNNNLSPLGKF